jgi:uncharacterized protein (TIGR00297 family)
VTFRLGYLLLALGVNSVAALGALWRRAVTRDGALAGLVVGAITLYLGGFFYWGMLMLFFVSSTIVSRIGPARKESLARIHEKDDRRDAVQVLANGGTSVLALALFGITGKPAFAVAAAAGFAAVNSDTWASELGVLSATPPRSIIRGDRLPAGASGGVTTAGTLASVGGSALVGIWFAAGIWIPGSLASAGPEGAYGLSPLAALGLVTVAGALGSVVDSILGATIQAHYRAPDGSYTERKRTGSQANTLVQGLRAVTNDTVNFLSSAAAALMAGGAAALVT